jgi:hypothetical protein
VVILRPRLLYPPPHPKFHYCTPLITNSYRP